MKRRLEETFDEEANTKSKYQKLETVEFYDIPEVVHHIFEYLRGSALNNTRLVCKTWYTVQNSNYFVQLHVKNMNILHNAELVEEGKIQTKRVGVILGSKSGLMTIKSNSEDSWLKGEYMYKNNKRHGRCVDYLKNGKIVEECYYLDGKRHGPCVKYFAKIPDVVERECNYQNGKLHGRLVEYVLRNGKQVKDSECHYLNGKLHGLKYEYDSNGTLIRQAEYENGKKHGKHIKYFKESNKKEYECEYVNGKQHGQGIEYYQDGQTFAIQQYENGKLMNQTINEGKKKTYAIASTN